MAKNEKNEKAEKMAKAEAQKKAEAEKAQKKEALKARFKALNANGGKLLYRLDITENNKVIHLNSKVMKKLAELYEAEAKDFKTYYSYNATPTAFNLIKDMLEAEPDIFGIKAEAEAEA